MELETIKLVRRLCTEAGVIMEDMNPVALMMPNNFIEIRAVVDQLTRDIARMGAIVAAAGAILNALGETDAVR